MDEEKYQIIYEKAKKFYWEIGMISSSAFRGEKIEVGAAGWRHILWKGKEPRPFEDRLRRFSLLKYIKQVTTKGKIVFYREDIKNGVLGKFWRIQLRINGGRMKVVVRQLDSGPKHFFSIMN